MSWYRIESTMPAHAKYAPLSDAAFRLAVTAGAWCAQWMTDGLIPKSVVPTLTAAPRGKALARAIAELTDPSRSIWISAQESYELHDYLSYNLSRAEWQAKVEAGKKGGDAKASANPKKQPSKRLAPARAHAKAQPEQEPKQEAGTSSSVPLADSDSDSDLSEIEIPPTPQGETKTKTQRVGPPPEDFEADAATLSVARETGRDWRADWAQCRDWHIAQGSKKFKADYQATLRGWMRRGLDGAGNGGRKAPHGDPALGYGPQPNDPSNRYRPRMFGDP